MSAFSPSTFWSTLAAIIVAAILIGLVVCVSLFAGMLAEQAAHKKRMKLLDEEIQRESVKSIYPPPTPYPSPLK
jgi:hypothetical protein